MFGRAISGVVVLAIVQIVTGLLLDLMLDAIMIAIIFWLHKKNSV